MNRRNESTIRRSLLYDEATGLPGHLLTLELLDRLISLAHRNDRVVALLELGVYGKSGAPTGSPCDSVFRRLAGILKATIRNSDFIGVDEDRNFVIVFADLFSPGDANKVVTRLIQRLRREMAEDLGTLTLAGGISLCPIDGTDTESLLQKARNAHRSAIRNKTIVAFASQQISQSILEQTVLEERLLQALDTGELGVRYRIQYGLTSNRAEGIEALLYWRHPEFGMISSSALVTLAEDLGLSVKLGTFVLEHAIAHHHIWSGNPADSLDLLVYLPASSFIDRRFLDIVHRVLAEMDIPPGRLSLGFPEWSILQNPEKSSQVLPAFADLGVRLSVFGFGGGYTSLAGLVLYPVDSITLDSTVVRNGITDLRARRMLEAIMAASTRLNCPVIASGVQTTEQAEWLRDLGCTRAQGPLFGPPVEGEALALQLSGPY
ncbi:MAG: EAL domain-containing protein [Gammaproteobacteria bacterium]|nr:EAL domain-containing protein [Gammaproteobacteria bacterium]